MTPRSLSISSGSNETARASLQDEKRAVDHGRAVGGNLQLIHRLIKARVRGDVRAKTHAVDCRNATTSCFGK